MTSHFLTDIEPELRRIALEYKQKCENQEIIIMRLSAEIDRLKKSSARHEEEKAGALPVKLKQIK